MKTNLFTFFLLAIVPLQAQTQTQENVSEETIQIPLEESAAPAPTENTARILGSLNDGTPPPPAPPKPPFIVAPRNVIEATTHAQGGRTITHRKIKPIALPPPLKPPVIDMKSPEVMERIAAHRAKFPAKEFLCMGATVYTSSKSPPRTLATIYSTVDHERISFWSSADFSYLSGFPSFVGSDGKPRSLFMMWSFHNLDRILSPRAAAMGRKYELPAIPAFPAGDVGFSIVGNQPDARTLASIQSLHDLYQNELPRLKAAYEGRKRAQLEREAFLQANPPQPKDIVLNYWRIESNDAAMEQGGGQ